jgi:YHS domain-containing protein
MLLAASCGNRSDRGTELEAPRQMPVPEEVMQRGPAVIDIPTEQLGSDKDLVCLMPVSLGIADTITHNGKLYGFCASQCKEAFIKNPGAYLKN